jgi:predicted transcriptional regulator/lambda repressor-like predicted transcriptional regulator
MRCKPIPNRILFGLKVKHLRQSLGLSFLALSHQTGLSVSYLNEIERGKKYPKSDKLISLSMVLGKSPEQLTTFGKDDGLDTIVTLLDSNFLNELPLELFGIDLAKVIEIIAQAPTRVEAFISTLLELSRNYSLRQESFYFAALRSYLEMHQNYFEDLEEAVEQFIVQHNVSDLRPFPDRLLRDILTKTYDYQIDFNGLDQYKTLKDQYYYLFLPKSKHLLLSGGLNGIQKSFSFGKELAFNFLHLKERSYTSSIAPGKVFEEVLNHSKAIYFSVALHLPKESFIKSISVIFSRKDWHPDYFLNLLTRFMVTPEMFYHRLTNMLPRFFGLKDIFFMRFVHLPNENALKVDRELHLNKKHQPHGNQLSEHYCRRWIAVSSILNAQNDNLPMMYAEIAHFQENRESYLCLTHCRLNDSGTGSKVSLTLGILLDKDLPRKIAFATNEHIVHKQVHTTCERCPINDCKERAAPPVQREKKKKAQDIEVLLNSLLNS